MLPEKSSFQKARILVGQIPALPISWVVSSYFAHSDLLGSKPGGDESPIRDFWNAGWVAACYKNIGSARSG
jgi:hypothetical protein